jgi:hypothetical protein
MTNDLDTAALDAEQDRWIIHTRFSRFPQGDKPGRGRLSQGRRDVPRNHNPLARTADAFHAH